MIESDVEAAALEWLRGIGWEVAHGPDIGPDAPASERAGDGDGVPEQRLRNAMERLNPTLPAEALDDAFRELTRPGGAQVSVLDCENPANNDWLAVNQFTVAEGEHERRPDIVLFVNGLPLGLIELKNPADEKATVWTAWQQIQTCKAELSDLFAFNAALVAGLPAASQWRR